MRKIVGCSIIIKDDFNNVLVVQRKVKKNEPKKWDIFSRNIRGKESPEKCINRAIKEDLKTIIFDLTLFKEYVIDDETGNITLVYTGSVKERVTLHADIIMSKWINLKDIESYDFVLARRIAPFEAIRRGRKVRTPKGAMPRNSQAPCPRERAGSCAIHAGGQAARPADG